MATRKPARVFKLLMLDAIVIDCSIHARADGLDGRHVLDLAEAIERGEELPPPVVFKQSGEAGQYLLAAGFHRVQAYRKAGKTKVRCEVRTGGRRDAILFAAGSDLGHGLKRSNADKRRCVALLLEAFPDWSNSRIAEAAGVSHTFVNNLRPELQLETVSSSTRTGLDGKKRPATRQPTLLDDDEDPPHSNGYTGEFPQCNDLNDVLQVETVSTCDPGNGFQCNPLNDELQSATVADCDPAPVHPFAEIMRMVSALSGAVTQAATGESEESRRLKDYLTACGVMDYTPDKIEHGEYHEAKESFALLRGLRKVIEVAGEGGPRKSDLSIRDLYEKHGGKLAPVNEGRRERKAVRE